MEKTINDRSTAVRFNVHNLIAEYLDKKGTRLTIDNTPGTEVCFKNHKIRQSQYKGMKQSVEGENPYRASNKNRRFECYELGLFDVPTDYCLAKNEHGLTPLQRHRCANGKRLDTFTERYKQIYKKNFSGLRKKK